jgi:hypothetical protein
LAKFNRFFKGKTDIYLESIAADFEDTKSDRLHEDIIPRGEAEECIDSLADSTRVSKRWRFWENKII